MDLGYLMAAEGKRIYLDSNATTKPSRASIDTMCSTAREIWGNPSASHAEGKAALEKLDWSRDVFAGLMDVPKDTITFTSCGTESNNIALRGIMRRAIDAGRYVLITSAVEHPSINTTARLIQGCEHVTVPVDSQGYVNIVAYRTILQKYKRKIGMVSVIFAQNEVGTIQKVGLLARMAREIVGDSVVFHTDATQALGKYYIYPRMIGVDILTGSAHKFHGPRGVGVLYARQGLVEPDKTPMTGGGQEKGCRSGTENVPAIAGAAVAFYEALGDSDAQSRVEYAMRENRDGMLRILVANVPGLVVNGDPRNGLYNTISVSLPGVHGHQIVETLDEMGIAISSGSACHKGKPSETLVAMYGEANKDLIHGTLRISISKLNGAAECELAARRIAAILSGARRV